MVRNSSITPIYFSSSSSSSSSSNGCRDKVWPWPFDLSKKLCRETAKVGSKKVVLFLCLLIILRPKSGIGLLDIWTLILFAQEFNHVKHNIKDLKAYILKGKKFLPKKKKIASEITKLFFFWNPEIILLYIFFQWHYNPNQALGKYYFQLCLSRHIFSPNFRFQNPWQLSFILFISHLVSLQVDFGIMFHQW